MVAGLGMCAGIAGLETTPPLRTFAPRAPWPSPRDDFSGTDPNPFAIRRLRLPGKIAIGRARPVPDRAAAVIEDQVSLVGADRQHGVPLTPERRDCQQQGGGGPPSLQKLALLQDRNILAIALCGRDPPLVGTTGGDGVPALHDPAVDRTIDGVEFHLA